MVRKGSTLVALGAAIAVVGAAPALAAQGAGTVTVTAGKPSEFKFTVKPASVAKGSVTFKVTNSGSLEHDFKIGGKATKELKRGKSQTIKVTFAKAGKFQYLCTVPGHAAAGMKGTLTVK